MAKTATKQKQPSLPMVLPKCTVHRTPMEFRPLKHQTYEQRFCGAWYDCQEPGCGRSFLFESTELKAQLAEQTARCARAA